MLKVTTADGANIELVMWMTSPAVYLDHWAVREFSDDVRLADRLRDALNAKGGTLAISWANLAEFANMGGASVQRAEAFLDSLVDRLFFVDPNPFAVMLREEHFTGQPGESPPHANVPIAREIMTLRPSTPKPLTAIGMLDGIPGSNIVQRRTDLANVFLKNLGDMRDEYRDDPTFRRLVKGTAKTGVAPAPTRFVLRHLVGGLLADQSAKITANDAMDCFHAVVSTAYCDFVLLDGRWAAAVNSARAAVAGAAPGAVRVATAFSKRDDGVERFLQALAADE